MSDATVLDEKSTTAEIVAEALDQWVASPWGTWTSTA